jgi:hypothetical protein
VRRARTGTGRPLRGGNPAARRSARKWGSAVCVLSASVRIRRFILWMNVESSGTYQSPKGGRCSRNGIAASAASRTAGIGRLAAGATVGSDFGGIACWGWCRRQGRTRLRAEGVSSNDLKGKLLREARTPLGGSPARLTAGAAGAKESCRGGRQTCSVSPHLARIGQQYGWDSPRVSPRPTKCS